MIAKFRISQKSTCYGIICLVEIRCIVIPEIAIANPVISPQSFYVANIFGGCVFFVIAVAVLDDLNVFQIEIGAGFELS